MIDNLKTHITPDDYMADLDEIADGSEPRSRCKYYIEPYGSFGINEVCDANYYPGNKVPYHEHSSGFETFLVDNGSLEVYSKSKKAVATKGDIVHIPPFTPHSIVALEENTIWRAFHQGMYMVRGIIEDRRLRASEPELINEFIEADRARGKSVWFGYDLAAALVPKSEIREIRDYDYAHAEFDFNGIKFMLKVGRWETNGAKEVWQLRAKKGSVISWESLNPFTQLYDVYRGRVEVKLDGLKPFTAVSRDLIHVPRLLKGSITVLEDSVLLDMGCQSRLLRFLDELNTVKLTDSDKMDDSSFIRGLMKKHDNHIMYQ